MRLDTPGRFPYFPCFLMAGRVAQRESTPFTREGSQVQSLSRPPSSPDFRPVRLPSRRGESHVRSPVSGTGGYAAEAAALVRQYEAIPFAAVHRAILAPAAGGAGPGAGYRRRHRARRGGLRRAGPCGGGGGADRRAAFGGDGAAPLPAHRLGRRQPAGPGEAGGGRLRPGDADGGLDAPRSPAATDGDATGGAAAAAGRAAGPVAAARPGADRTPDVRGHRRGDDRTGRGGGAAPACCGSTAGRARRPGRMSTGPGRPSKPPPHARPWPSRRRRRRSAGRIAPPRFPPAPCRHRRGRGSRPGP